MWMFDDALQEVAKQHLDISSSIYDRLEQRQYEEQSKVDVESELDVEVGPDVEWEYKCLTELP